MAMEVKMVMVLAKLAYSFFIANPSSVAWCAVLQIRNSSGPNE